MFIQKEHCTLGIRKKRVEVATVDWHSDLTRVSRIVTIAHDQFQFDPMRFYCNKEQIYLLVSTHLKNSRQNRNLSQVGVKRKRKYLKPPPRRLSFLPTNITASPGVHDPLTNKLTNTPRPGHLLWCHCFDYVAVLLPFWGTTYIHLQYQQYMKIS